MCFSAVKDKSYGSMVSMLQGSGLFEFAVALEMEEERGVCLDELRKYFSQYDSWHVIYAKGAEEGLKMCMEEKGPEDVVYIVGSLYLIGLIKSVLRRNYHD